MERTGPKISSRAMRWDWLTSGEQRRAEPEPALGQRAFGLVHLGALFDARLDQLLDLVELLPAVDGPDVGVLVERVAHPEGLQARLQLVEDGLETPIPARAGASRRSRRAPG